MARHFYPNLKYLTIMLLVLGTGISVSAQYSIWSFRAGPSLAFQRWNGLGSTQPLIGYHGVIGLESYDPGKTSTFYGELGYHQRGSSKYVPAYQSNAGINYSSYTIRNVFHNVALALGGRKSFGQDNKFFYNLALRGEYTIKAQLSDVYVGFSEFVKNFNYGLDVGAGYNFPIGYHMGFIQVQLQPDLSKQIWSTQYSGFDYQGNPVTYPEQKVINYTFELSLGFRLYGNLIPED
ncbi:MAG TPA: hypothetical protein PLR22_07115 [Saprospiraceae bacterium]|nr:hypothetical protein [Saprospiraceae bacterium]